jgi:hypothetical protein
MLRQRNRNAFAEDPRLVELERRLLNLGGLLALLFLHEPQIAELLERGRYFPGAKARIRRGQRSACHSNVSLLFVLTEGAVRIATGYGLSPDGLWSQHSWGMAEEGRIIETTRRRLRSYGFVLDDPEILPFVLGNLRFGDLEPGEEERVIQLIAQFADLAPEEVLDLIERGADVPAPRIFTGEDAAHSLAGR